ncbi:MAG: response regulator transcription factor [Deltaproteobacteria bacterium]|nr:response regulator transcription factor [Deltaproteobacteria bacterium]
MHPDTGDDAVAAAEAIHVLFVEDNERLARLTTQYLASHGVLTTHAADGNAGLREAQETRFDVVLLDVMLPGRDGVELCREIRSRMDVPIIMVTARSEEADRVLGLESGADDYLSKPFSSRELLARIRAQVRRARGRAGPPSALIKAGRLVLDPHRLAASLDGVALELTAAEFNLLRVFAERPGRVLGREQLLDLAKGSAEEAFDRSVDSRISRLRQKLGDDPKRPRLLKTVRGAGYVLIDGNEP